MKIFRGFRHPAIAPSCALTIGNFDGVHRGHEAMLALLNAHAAERGVASCVLTFEPHPRDFFAAVHHKPDLAPARISTLRDKLAALARFQIAPEERALTARFGAAYSAYCARVRRWL